MKKNFVLLSKAAKEKKYAQEYLGLLARRGDLGSIRIGKRWYTTEEWFSEFLKDAQMRKAEIKAAEAVSEPARVLIKKEKEEIEKISFAERVKMDEKIDVKKYFAEIQPEFSRSELKQMKETSFQTEEKREIRIPHLKREEAGREKAGQSQGTPVRTIIPMRKFETVDLRKFRTRKPAFRGVSEKTMNGLGTPEKERAQEGFPERAEMVQEWKTVPGNSSPDFSSFGRENPLFPKFAFSASVVLVLVLLLQAGWIFQDKMKSFAGVRSGIVAGAEDSKINLETMKNLSIYYLESKKSSMRENISLSRVLLSAALERNSAQEGEINTQ